MRSPESKITIVERPQRWDAPFGKMTEADVRRLVSMEPFSEMDAMAFPAPMTLQRLLENDTRIVRYAAGEIVVRAGDYGNSAFLILGGTVVVVHDPLPEELLGRPAHAHKSLLGWLTDLWRHPAAAEERDPESMRRRGHFDLRGHGQETRVFLQDFPTLVKGRSTARMHQGEMFGELAALGRIPRTATVVAEDDVEVLEIRWQGLRDILKRDAALRTYVDRIYRERGLVTHLHGTALFAHLSEQELETVSHSVFFEHFGDFDWYGSFRQIREASAAERLADEPVIIEEGSSPDGVVLVRSGFVRVSRREGSGEKTLSYLGRGQWYGFDELLQSRGTGEPTAYACTLRGVGYTDVLRVPASVLDTYIFSRLSPDALERLRRPLPSASAPKAATASQDERKTIIMEHLVESRYINGTSAMVIDLARCTRCDDCVRACASAHEGNPRFVRHGPRFDQYMFANACMHCSDPVCMIGCPTGAIFRDASMGEVRINESTCIGCATCANNCPYENIRMVELRDASGGYIRGEDGQPIRKATKCDLCSAQGTGPSCQRACPHDALIRVDLNAPETFLRWVDR